MAHLKERKHLFFDLDDTLWDLEKNSSTVLKELFTEFDLQKKLNTSFTGFYAVYKNINQHLWTRFYLKEIDRAYLRNNRFHLAFQHFSYDHYEENLQVTNQYMHRSPKGKLLKAGCLQTLDSLKQAFQLHIITNGFRDTQRMKLENCGLSSYFSTVIISEEYDLAKPDEKIFRLAESLAGAHCDHCVMIGDNFDCDVQGALRAGWEAIYFSEEKPRGFQGYHISHLGDLPLLF